MLTGHPVQVCLSRLQLAAPAHSVSLVSPHILVGLDTGAIMVYLNLGRGDLVQQQVTGSTHSTSTSYMLKMPILLIHDTIGTLNIVSLYIIFERLSSKLHQWGFVLQRSLKLVNEDLWSRVPVFQRQNACRPSMKL